MTAFYPTTNGIAPIRQPACAGRRRVRAPGRWCRRCPRPTGRRGEVERLGPTAHVPAAGRPDQPAAVIHHRGDEPAVLCQLADLVLDGFDGRPQRAVPPQVDRVDGLVDGRRDQVDGGPCRTGRATRARPGDDSSAGRSRARSPFASSVERATLEDDLSACAMFASSGMPEPGTPRGAGLLADWRVLHLLPGGGEARGVGLRHQGSAGIDLGDERLSLKCEDRVRDAEVGHLER